MSKTINISTESITQGTKEDAWFALGKKYKADTLEVLENGDRDKNGEWIQGDYGYHLEWETEEDDIHVFGEKEDVSTMIKVDEIVNCKESIKKLENAVKCAKEIEANKRKYY